MISYNVICRHEEAIYYVKDAIADFEIILVKSNDNGVNEKED